MGAMATGASISGWGVVAMWAAIGLGKVGEQGDGPNEDEYPDELMFALKLHGVPTLGGV